MTDKQNKAARFGASSLATQFKPGNTAKADLAQAKGRLTSKFVRTFLADFEAHGEDAIRSVRETDPSTYVRVAAAFVPKELEITRPLGEMSEDELTAIIGAIRQTLSGFESAGSGTGTEAVGEPDPALSAVH